MRNWNPRSGLENLAVMVIDDSSSMRELLITLLHAFGVGTVGQASNGIDALKRMDDIKPDIVLVDWVVEKLDGPGFVRTLRQDEASPFRHVPILMITANANREAVTEARDAGINEFMVKPITGKGLAARLETLIHRPRPFVRTATYYGPDRRRKSEVYEGEERRMPAGDGTTTMSAAQLGMLAHMQEKVT